MIKTGTYQIHRRLLSALILSAGVVALNGCASSILNAEDSDKILQTNDYDKSVDIKEIAVSSAPSGEYVRLPGPAPVEGAFPAPASKNPKTAKSATKSVLSPVPTATPLSAQGAAMAKAAAPTAGARQPSIEDSEGFIGRRPAVDPFRAGEKVTLEVSYFKVVAGDITFENRGLAEVNGRKSYRFAGTAHSTSVFAMFYAIDDWFETFVDYETLVPQSYSLHVKESKQLREVRTLFDWSKKTAKYWDKKINSEKKLEEKNIEWEIPAFSQNVFSAIYYLRTFTLKPGKKIKMRVAHEGKNLELTADVLRREKLSTDAGEFDCVVLKPTIAIDGHFKPVGDIFIWLTDDDRKFLVRVESKIKIGTVVGEIKSLDKGR